MVNNMWFKFCWFKKFARERSNLRLFFFGSGAMLTFVLFWVVWYHVLVQSIASSNAATLAAFSKFQVGLINEPSGLDDPAGVLAKFVGFFSRPMKICTFPVGPSPTFLKNVSAEDCFASLSYSTRPDKYKLKNVNLDEYAVNGTYGYAWYSGELCGVATDGNCVNDTTIELKDIVRFDFDDDNRINGYQDWWEADLMARVDALVAAHAANRSKLTSQVTAKFVGYPLVVGVILLFMSSVLIVGFCCIGPRHDYANWSEQHKVLLPTLENVRTDSGHK
mmetsp:Transcript_109377/g.189834  ORF Transcript_109377/g.189834 Transcript_109377/m.189834 type:complete len:277 (-) Transcript_109377:312-1142(-)